MKPLILIATFLMLIAPLPAFGQESAVDEKPLVSERRQPAGTGSNAMTAAQEARLADTIRGVRDNFESQRYSGGFGDLLGGVIVGALGGYVAYVALQEDPANFGLGLFGLGIAGYGLNDIVSGIWKLSYATPQERIANKLLDDPTALRSSGMLFLEQEAYRARRARYVGGTLSILTGLSAGILVLPLIQEDRVDPLLVGLIGLTAGIQVFDGLFTLIGQSGPEKRYEEMQNVMGEEVSLHEPHLVPTIVTSRTVDKTAIGPGVSAGFRF